MQLTQTVDTLRKVGIPASSIGIMSVYRSQLKVLTNLVTPDHPAVEILTADRFQGRDKEVVIISLVRSNPENYIGELLQDWRRMNVAFTRAKSKLIIFGSCSTIRETAPLDEFVKLVERKGWVYQIPTKAVVTDAVVRSSPRKQVKAKENMPPSGFGVKGGKIMKVTGSTVLKGRPMLRDIVNEHR
jgi:DNA replication ATP-dependent helicase Dna2